MSELALRTAQDVVTETNMHYNTILTASRSKLVEEPLATKRRPTVQSRQLQESLLLVDLFAYQRKWTKLSLQQGSKGPTQNQQSHIQCSCQRARVVSRLASCSSRPR